MKDSGSSRRTHAGPVITVTRVLLFGVALDILIMAVFTGAKQ